MRLSSLQKYILLQCYLARKTRIARGEFLRFYAGQANAPKTEDRLNALTKSMERLIDKGLMVGYGRRTPMKWFIDEVKLLPAGRWAAKRLIGQQQTLPLHLTYSRKNNHGASKKT